MQPIHWSVTDRLTIYAGDDPLLEVHKHYDLVNTVKACSEGKLTIPAFPDPIEITDHPWLMRLASDVARLAAIKLEDGQ